MPETFSKIFSDPVGEKIESSENVVNPIEKSYMLREDDSRMLREDYGFIVREG